METQKIQGTGTSNGSQSRITILVEEELLVRKLWEDHFQKRGWQLEVFENPLVFLSQLGRFTGLDERVWFFFDQDFGQVRGVGLEMARAVKDLNRDQIVSLVTNYSPDGFEANLRSGQIQYVLGKYPEFVFGEDFLTRKFSEQIELFALAYPTGRCALEKALNFEGWDLQFRLETHCRAFAPKAALNKTALSTQPEQGVPQPYNVSLFRRVWGLIFDLNGAHHAPRDVRYGQGSV